ncbi:SagB family peptide dehydrogenase [Couchioplanes azureus]|uniref:SagB family peptide dehydrogenase n=1 Tax=Couchioplanes caeruleus TaxID=56438 RepID=UPI0016706E05|nr:SagB family peptide dehydrogenase [Couchioplanes caeruleus]GGQ66814.1 hypothetical protein GCM10010166_40800 [Couchioplanes caeruleus subsp. azureus]
MGNQDLQIGERYLRRTVYEAADLFAEAMRQAPAGPDPLPFKVYRQVPRRSLPEAVPEEIAADGEGPLDDRRLSTLLYYTYGFSRWDVGPGAVWPYHRTVPSARCYFPTELYLWLPESDGPAGVYHYDALHHALALIRPGDFRAELARILGARLDGARGVLLLSSLFWKNAFKYRGYAYRLCAQEAGMVLGNALLVADRLGLRGEASYRFLDRRAGRLLGFPRAEEHLFAALALYPGTDPAGERARPDPVEDDLPDLALPYVRPEGPAHPHDPLFRSIAENCLLDDEDQVAAVPPAAPGCAVGGTTLAMPPGGLPGVELGAALRARDSGNVLFHPVARTLPNSVFWEIAGSAVVPYRSDLRAGTGVPGVSLDVVVLDVEGLAAGIYRFCPDHGGLHPVREGNVARQLQGALPVPNINLLSAAVVLYLSADYAAASRTFGNRAYRMVNIEAGVVAQRICVRSAARGLSARVHNGYDAAGVASILGLADAGLTPFFQIAVARNRPGVQVGLPITY